MKKILVIEDEKQYREMLAVMLQEAGFVVETAPNGKQGIEKVQAHDDIALILLDLLMPDVDGITFYYQLVKMLKKHIPVIVLTNVSDATGYEKDIKEVLIKSNVSLQQVLETVKKYV